MTEKHYFPLDLMNGDLEVLIENIRHTPGYLDSPLFPFSEKVRTFLKERAEVTVIEDLDDLEELDLVYESTRLFRELKDAKDRFGESDHTEAMAYFRTSTSLMEKLVTMRERANNIKQISTFYGLVLGAMEEMLEPGQITELRNRLKDFVND